MMRIVRIACFYLFVTVYFISCPLVILYALGYVVQPGSEEGIVKTGLISVSTTPPGASVYLGKRRYTKRTPTILRSLLPGEYPLRIALKDYHPWARVVPVEAEKATVFEKILLIPQQFHAEPLLGGPFDRLIPVPGTRYLLVGREDRLADELVYDGKERKAWPLFRADSPYRRGRALRHQTVRESHALLLEALLPEGVRTLWIERLAENSEAQDITALLSEPPFRASWDPADRRHLTVVRHDALSRVDLVTKTVSPTIVDGVQGHGLFERTLYLLKDNGVLLRADSDGKDSAVLLHNPGLLQSLFGSAGGFRIDVFAKDAIVFSGDRGEVLAGRLPYRFVAQGVRGMEWVPRRLLLWQRDALGLIEFPRRAAEDGLLEPVPEFRWLIKRRRDVTYAAWVHGGSYVVFLDGNEVLLLEADPLEASSPPVALFHVKPEAGIMYVEELGKLYYLDAHTGGLVAVELVPRRKGTAA